MPAMDSTYWIQHMDLCTKHCLRLPCQECILTQDKDLRVEFTPDDFNFLGHHRKRNLKDLFPPEWKWMFDRMIN